MSCSILEKHWKRKEIIEDIKLVTSDKRRKRLVLEPNYHSHKKFSEHLMAKTYV